MTRAVRGFGGFGTKRIVGRLGAALACVSSATVAATWQDSASLAFDTAVRIEAGVLERGQVLVRRFQLAPGIVDPGLPANVRIAALAPIGNDILYVPDISFALGGVLVTPRDVVRLGVGGSSIHLRGNDLGLPGNVRIDALALAGADVLFSLDLATSINGTRVGPADILRWNGASVSILHASQALALSSGVNLTALERFSNGNLLMGFDVAGSVGGVAFRPGEILEYTPATGHWSLARGQSRFGVVCSPCVLDAFAAIGNPDVLFRSGMERYED